MFWRQFNEINLICPFNKYCVNSIIIKIFVFEAALEFILFFSFLSCKHNDVCTFKKIYWIQNQNNKTFKSKRNEKFWDLILEDTKAQILRLNGMYVMCLRFTFTTTELFLFLVKYSNSWSDMRVLFIFKDEDENESPNDSKWLCWIFIFHTHLN